MHERWFAFLIAGSILAGCGASEPSRSEGGNSAAVQQERDRWTEVIYMGSWAVQFEKGGELSRDDQAIIFDGQALRRSSGEMQVQGHWYEFAKRAHVRFFRPAPTDLPVKRRFGPAELIWENGSNRILIEERRPGPTPGTKIAWHFPRGRVEVQSDGQQFLVVHVDENDHRTSFGAQAKVRVGRDGQLPDSER